MTQATTSTAGPDSAPVAGWSRASAMALGVVVMVGMVLGWVARAAALNVNGDDAIYLTLSQSLGAGHYRDEYLVGTPPHAQYPPGMAVWLLLVRLVAGPGLDAILAGNFLLLAAMTCLLADAVCRLSRPWLGVVAAAAVAFNPGILSLGAELRSEPLYLAFCALALWCVVDPERERQAWRPAVAFAAAIAAFLTRSAGIALLAAIAVALLMQRRWRPLVLGGTASILITGAWFAYTRWATARTIGHTYAIDLAGAAPVGEPLRFLDHLLSNATGYFSYLAARQFNIPDIGNFPLDNGFWGLLLIVPAGVGAWQLARRWPAMVAFLLLSTAILLVYPWYIVRLLTALLPWLMVVVLFGWLFIASVAKLRDAIRAPLCIGVLLAALAIAAQVPVSLRGLRCRTTAPFSDPRCASLSDRSYVAAATFIRDSLPPVAVIAASKPSSIYHNSQRRTIPLSLFERRNAESLVAPAGPATHILLSRKFPYEAMLVAPWLHARCTSFALSAKFPGGTLLLGPRTTSSGDACEALQQYLQETPPDFGDDAS